MKHQSKVTIIINCFNGENFINDCISSVLAQSYTNWELVFWDNLSTDNTAKIIKKSNLIAFLDVDDIWHKDKLKYQVAETNKNKNFSFCYTKTKELYDNFQPPRKNNLILSKINALFFSSKLNDRLLISNFIYFSSVLINVNLLNDKKLFNDKYKQAEDYDLLLKLSFAGKVIYIDKELTTYRIHNNNLTTSQYGKSFSESLEILEAYKENKYSNLGKTINYLKLSKFLFSKKQYYSSIIFFVRGVLSFLNFGILYVFSI
jgi:glycosyltransferase involved in cell wall biosynthesis